MAIIVEHEKRKKEILDKALDVFVEEGYDDTTFQKIADRCGITRTTLYLYFSNKRDLFLWSIKQLTNNIQLSLSPIIEAKDKDAKTKLEEVFDVLIDSCKENQKLFNVLLPYLIQLKKTGKNPEERVQRRIIKLRHLLSTVIIEGINNNEFKKLSISSVNDVFYSIIESYIFKLAVLNQNNPESIKNSVKIAIQGILV